MKPIVYRVVGTRGRWFIEHSGGRYGPLPTKKAAIKLAAAASNEGESRGLEVIVAQADSKGS